ncbi:MULTISPECIES: HAD family hydrolase [Pseudomonas]|uniref:HAD-superfamily hydrolase, subfamily IA, variant 1 and 3 n=1 Tax=Pseudomonas fluorescens (strain Q2-87) TaxID=1038922 RepID=J2F5W9_PSEFQ|nr:MULTISPECIES: HAD family hydrolase [Pseudomonas]EJL04453.1 HAD-superfamily hydrolase, subfamily IA, variant 1 and 3 [Pseudomonas fluorescens Q2-87]
MPATIPSDTGYRAFLFDMDGTLLNSIAAAERIWTRWALRHGVDVATFLPTIHGVRAIDTIARQRLPGVDARAEAEQITREEIEDVEGVVQVPGASQFLKSLPPDRWAIVTSAPLALALRRMEAAGIARPHVMITAEDVSEGKPDPACYRLAAERLQVPPQTCLVFEDAHAGIQAGEAAEADVIVVTATHTHPLASIHPLIEDYRGLAVDMVEGGLMRLGMAR